MELELKNLMDTVSGIHDKMVYLRDREIQWWKIFTDIRTFRLKAGVAAENWVDVAKKGSIEAMELESKKLMDTVSEIHDEIVYLHDREMQTEIRLSRGTFWRNGRQINGVPAAKDWVDSKKKYLLDAMELELKKLMDTVSGIHDEMVYLRDREDGNVNIEQDNQLHNVLVELSLD